MKKLTFALMGIALVSFSVAKPLSNEDLDGLYSKSIEQVLRLEPDEVDLGTAALIIAEEWSEVVPGRHYQRELDDMAYEIQARLQKKKWENSYKAVEVINEYLFEELDYRAVKEATDPNDLFMNSVMDNQRGYCLSLSILYLAIGERLGLPLYGVVVPGHFFVRYDNGRIRFNIETTGNGGYATDEHYHNKFNVPADYGDRLYMKNLNKRQSLGCLFNNLGNVYSDTGNLKMAQMALERAVEINPYLAESQTNLGNIYLQKGLTDKAIYQYREALDINPDDGKTYNNLGNAYMQKDWISDAMRAYTQAIKLDPNAIEARTNLASLYADQGQFETAKSLLREAVALEPESSGIYNQLGWVYYQAEDYERALTTLNKAARLDRKNAEAHLKMGLCYNKQGMTKSEIRAYKTALGKNPNMVAALFHLGNAYFGQKKYGKAIKQYKKAAQINPSDAAVHYNLGAAYANEDDFAEAVEHYDLAVEADPKMAEAHKGLVFACYKLKDYVKAAEHLDIALGLGAQIDEKVAKAVRKKAR